MSSFASFRLKQKQIRQFFGHHDVSGLECGCCRMRRKPIIGDCPLCRCALRLLETTVRCTSTDCPFVCPFMCPYVGGSCQRKFIEVVCDQKCIACEDDFCGLDKEHPGKHECVNCGGDCNLRGEGERAAGAVGYVAYLYEIVCDAFVENLTSNTCGGGRSADSQLEEFFNSKDVERQRRECRWIKFSKDSEIGRGDLVRGYVQGPFIETEVARLQMVCKDGSLIVVAYDEESKKFRRERWFLWPTLVYMVDKEGPLLCAACHSVFTFNAICAICRMRTCDACRAFFAPACCSWQEAYQNIKVRVKEELVYERGERMGQDDEVAFDDIIATMRVNNGKSYRRWAPDTRCEVCDRGCVNFRCHRCHAIKCDGCRDKTSTESNSSQCCSFSQRIQELWNSHEGEETREMI